jgi:hypothetical protein
MAVLVSKHIGSATSFRKMGTSVGSDQALYEVDVSYDINAALKGGIKYVSITKDSALTGVYYLKLKNVNKMTDMSNPPTDLYDVPVAYPISSLVNVYVDIASSSALSNVSTSVALDPTNNRAIIYTYNQSGAVDVATSKINVNVVFSLKQGRKAVAV